MRRKKWSEEEEETLISKYGEMLQAGTLAKLKTREKKFEPIAAHVNVLHHFRDNVSFPWEWTWRDLSVKIQNMRHQYLGVKQKIRRASDLKEQGQQDEYDWAEGIVHWSNFLRYKEVFGDLELDPNELGIGSSSPASTHPGKSFDGKTGRVRGRASGVSSKARLALNGDSRIPGEGGGSVGGNLDKDLPNTEVAMAEIPGLGLECDCDEAEEDGRDEEDELGSKKKRPKRIRDRMNTSDGAGVQLIEGKILAFLGAYITEQRDKDAQREARERDKEREREERESLREAAEREREQNRLERERIREEQERRRDRERENREWEREALNRERWEEERQREREWEEKREREKREWRERMTTLQLGHQTSIAQMQAQMMQSQHNVVSLLLGVFLHGSPVEETPGQKSSLASQVLHTLQQQHSVGGTILTGERKGGMNDSTFHHIVDADVNVTVRD